MNKTKVSPSLLALLLIAGTFAGCLGGETIDDTARTDIDDLSSSTTENLTTINAEIDSMELDVTALSNSLGSLSSNLTDLENDLTIKETALLNAISTTEASIASLEAHNSALMTTLSGMNDSNSVEAQSLQAQITTNAANIATLSTELTTLTNDLAAVQSSIVALSSTMTSLESTLTSVESMATQNAADVHVIETTSATNAAAIANLVDQITNLTEDIDVLYQNLEDIGNQNDRLYNDLTYYIEEDWDEDGIVDFVFPISLMNCMEVSFEDLSYIDFGLAFMASTDFRYVDLSFANLSGVDGAPIPCSGIHTNYNGSVYDRTMFLHTDLSHAEVVNSGFPSSAFAFSILDYANFSYSNLSVASPLDEDSGENINFDWGWSSNGTRLDSNSAIGAIFYGSEMYNLNAYDNNFSMSSFKISNLFNATLEMNDFTNADFSFADLTNTSGYDNVWDGVDFSYADLTNSSLDFYGATGIIWYYTTCPDGSSSGSSGTC